MIAEQIENIKIFMEKLLLGTDFDHFLVTEVTITTYNTFHIDGHIQKDFFSREEYETHHSVRLSTWEVLKPFCYQIIKGPKTPLNFKIIFQMPDTIVRQLIAKKQLAISESDVNGFYLNMKYENNQLTCITGTSLNILELGKESEHAFDEYILSFVSTLS